MVSRPGDLVGVFCWIWRFLAVALARGRTQIFLGWGVSASCAR